jgi:abortive infection bacteriophage resistance protein
MIYDKKTLLISEHIIQLRDRGLIISNEEFAQHYLEHISYYRLAGYWWPMQSDKINHTFKENSKFEDVIALYNFDRELRVLLFDVIEKIEISLRTKLIYHLSHEFDPWWFQNTSFGSLSKLYGNLKNTIKSKDTIASELGAVNHTYLPSWLQSIAQIRNYCAHHSRLWNKNLPGTPKLLSKPPYKWVNDVPKDTTRLYVHLCIMRYMVNIIAPENSFSIKLQELMTKYPSIDPNALGMKSDWNNEPLWK